MVNILPELESDLSSSESGYKLEEQEIYKLASNCTDFRKIPFMPIGSFEDISLSEQKRKLQKNNSFKNILPFLEDDQLKKQKKNIKINSWKDFIFNNSSGFIRLYSFKFSFYKFSKDNK